MMETATEQRFVNIDNYEKDFLLELYERMVLIRQFEEEVKFLFLAGSMPGTIHQCQGQEATAVGVCSALNANDTITSTHRPQGHALAKGLEPLEILIELFGGGGGCCKGKGGSMHTGNMERGMVPAIAIVGGGIPIAAGMALAFKMKNTSQVVACFFGEGAVSEGSFHEGVNLAAIWDLPVIFVCENNHYAASTSMDLVTRADSVVDRASGYKIQCRRIFGNDVLGVHEATKEAAAACRAGKGPVLLELVTYRLTGHSRRDPCHYQPDDEKKLWFERDPIPLFSQKLAELNDIEEAELEQIRQRVKQRITDDIETAQNAPPPDLATLTTDVYCD
jgi:TPP-dependent pyruvate/acetoin dehydrogenase alpha subunit